MKIVALLVGVVVALMLGGAVYAGQSVVVEDVECGAYQGGTMVGVEFEVGESSVIAISSTVGDYPWTMGKWRHEPGNYQYTTLVPASGDCIVTLDVRETFSNYTIIREG